MSKLLVPLVVLPSRLDEKIRDRSCVAIEPKFSPMDFSKLVSHGASDDLGTMVLAQQTMMDKF